MQRFWENKRLEQLDCDEWEALCDRCGYCCLVKLQDEDTGAKYSTGVACRYLDLESCTCRDYANRTTNTSECIQLAITKPELFGLLPETCAYKRLWQGRPLAEWHPLLSGDADSVLKAGISVCLFAISEEYVHPEQLPEFILDKLD